MYHRLAAALAAIAVIVTACSGSSLPADARDSLLSYWDSLPSDPGIEHRVVDAWKGRVVAEYPDSGVPPSEIWCVEAEMFSATDPSLDGSRTVWIVTRGAGSGEWSAALLASLSSTWPNEACASRITD